MITIRKLQTLPHHTRLRKTVSLLAHMEKREPRIAVHRRYLRDLLQTLLRDRSLPREVRDIADTLRESLGEERRVGDRLGPESQEETEVDAYEQRLRRGVNTLRHELNAFLGRSAADWDVYDETGRELDAAERHVCGFYLYLEDLRSPFNVGAVFRAAESFGVRRIFLSPHSADPQHTRARRASMSTVDVLPWERASLDEARAAAARFEGPARIHGGSADPDGASGRIHGGPADPEALPLFALETGGSGISGFPFPERGLMVLGSEELGVSPAALTAADASAGRVTIETGGAKGSLNVGVAAGIALHAWWVRYGLSTIS
jgi:TrmH family RNA methyltransferase